MSVTGNLALRLGLERIRATKGAGVLDAMAVLAFTVSGWLALTVVGGSWMFFQRSRVDSILTDPQWVEVAPIYVTLAGIACALLVIPILSLGAAAARLGARGREQRLASLRLVGMTSNEVVRMSVIETLVQATIGIVLGSVIFAASLPAWQLLEFQAQRIGAEEMLLPWWLWLSVAALLLLLAMTSTVMGLRRVSISPLGVARDQTPRHLRIWRLAAVIALVIGFVIYLRLTGDPSTLVGLAVTMTFLAIVIGSINLAGPWLLQLVARPSLRTNRVPKLIAARRILDDPRGAWRNVSSLALLGFIAGFVVPMPTTRDGSNEFAVASIRDIQTGVAITLTVGLLLAATATLITQASQVFDRAPESIALDRMGVPKSVHVSVRRSLVILPLTVSLSTSVPLGFLLSSVTISAEMSTFPVAGATLLATTIIVGFLLTIAAAEACRPLQTGVLGQQRRRND